MSDAESPEKAQVTREKIMDIIKASGNFSEEDGHFYLNGRFVGTEKMLLLFPEMAIINRVAYIAAGKPEKEIVTYEIVTDEQRLPQVIKKILSDTPF